MVSFPRRRRPTPTDLLDRASELALEGRKVAIYDRLTGLYAPWYLEMRCAEECYRAIRYKRPLTLLLLQPDAASDPEQVGMEVADWLMREKRRSDLPGYLGNGRIAVLMPETDVRGAHGAFARLSRAVSGLEAAISSYPEDGGNWGQLKASAELKLNRILAAAA